MIYSYYFVSIASIITKISKVAMDALVEPELETPSFQLKVLESDDRFIRRRQLIYQLTLHGAERPNIFNIVISAGMCSVIIIAS